MLGHLLVLCHLSTPTEALRAVLSSGRPAIHTQRMMTTQLQFQNSPEEEILWTSQPHQSPPSSPSEYESQQFFAPAAGASETIRTQQNVLPVWLAAPQAHLLDSNLSSLKTALRNFYTETEILKVLFALEEASADLNDTQLLAGTADFLRLLVENTEIGLNALVAAAFHYCDAVRARRNPTSQHSFSRSSCEASFGTPCQNIANDAARLKSLENKLGQHEHTKDTLQHVRSLLLAETNDWRALAIRAGACLYRLEGILNYTTDALSVIHTKEMTRVARDALHVFAPLASRLGMHRLKNELERAAFQVLYPRQYQRVNQLSHRESMQQVLENVKGDLTALLQQDDEFSRLVKNFSVTARVKEPFSLWKKMLRCNYQDVLEVPDAMALRIVIEARKVHPEEPESITQARERALCYYAQKLCATQYAPRQPNPRFKDYIDAPKRNGYQSLHYTATYNDWTLEIQVRSMDMHRVAEFGLASHWDYKLQSKDPKSTSELDDDDDIEQEEENDMFAMDGMDNIDHSTEAYVRHVQQWHWQQHGGAHVPDMDTSELPESGGFTNIWQNQPRVDRIRARAQRLEPYLQALTVTQSELTRDFVFVFLEDENHSANGKVLALPAGACVLDALREGEKTLGLLYDDSNLALNGNDTSVTRQLHNGDVLTVPMQSMTP